MTTYTFGDRQVTGFPKREAEAIANMTRGMSAKEIARVMGISYRSVEISLTRSMARAGAKNRIHLASLAFAEGKIKVVDAAKKGASLAVMVMVLGFNPAAQSDDKLRTAKRVRVREVSELMVTV